MQALAGEVPTFGARGRELSFDSITYTYPVEAQLCACSLGKRQLSALEFVFDKCLSQVSLSEALPGCQMCRSR